MDACAARWGKYADRIWREEYNEGRLGGREEGSSVARIRLYTLEKFRIRANCSSAFYSPFSSSRGSSSGVKPKVSNILASSS